ncbi:MAG: SLC13/DASS family transporter [Methylococcaceae bacterium]|nr:MAG: SLC13/DASS family transporter [Methylococcaceae bacterium]
MQFNWRLWAGPSAFLAILLFADLSPGKPAVTAMAAVAAWMTIWWLAEAVHLSVTALLPLVLLPLLGIADTKSVAAQYMDPVIFLFIGGFLIALALERWDLHQRIALRILSWMGSSASRVLFGVMLTAYGISMWISNTATVMMLLAAVVALMVQLEMHLGADERTRRLEAGILIGLAYSATIGGMATLVGTPTNMVFLRFYLEKFPQNHDMNFFNWFAVGFPISLLFLLISFALLRWLFVSGGERLVIKRDYFIGEYRRLGAMDYEQIVVSVVFVLTALLWFSRGDIDFGGFTLHGWGGLFRSQEFVGDSTVAVAAALALFVIPSRQEPDRALLCWDEAAKLPFDIVLLFGGGFALAKGFELSGLSAWLGQQLAFVADANIYGVLLALCALIAVISEFASNVACIQLMLPVLLVLQANMGVHPLVLLVPATLAASLGFMLPVATAPNTIVFGTRRIAARDMLKAGLMLDVIGVLLITAAMGWMASGY